MGVEKIFSFAGWDKDHPQDRHPGDRLDAQFDAHAGAIQDLEQRIARLLRADGKLNHDLLTVELFPPALHEDLARSILAQARADRAAAEAALAEIRTVEQNVRAQLAEARSFASQSAREFAHSLGLVHQVVSLQEHLKDRIEPLTAAARDAVAGLTESENTVTLTLAAAENWADVSMHWAEYMPDTIPGNILATNAITGDHWSSRWWANQAAAAVGGMLYHFYLGPSATPPNTLPNGGPIDPGAIYFNTADGIMYVFNGTSWVPFNTPQPAGTAALFYAASANQTVFPLTVADLLGATVTLNPAKNQGVVVSLNGVRLVPNGGSFATGDFTVDKTTSTVTVATPVSAGAILAVDVLIDPADLAASGFVQIEKLRKLVFDGTTTTFPLLTSASAPIVPVADAAQLKVVIDGVDQEPGVDFMLAAAGASVQFPTAPAADSKNFLVYMRPAS